MLRLLRPRVVGRHFPPRLTSVRSVGTSDRDTGKSATAEAADRIADELTQEDITQLSDIDQHRRPMPSLMKELFMGRFQKLVLSYPDVFDADRYRSLERRCEKACRTLESKRETVQKIQDEKTISKDLLLALRSQGFFGLNVAREDGGEGLSMTETCRLMEELSVDASLSEVVGSAATTGHRAIQTYGTEELKSLHLQKLARGLEIGAWCLTDTGAGCDAASTTTVAYACDDQREFTIRGRKTWVVNGPMADVFTVFANVAMKDEAGVVQPYISAFAVPRSAEGVNVLTDESLVMSGLEGVSCCPVEFKDVTVPSSHLLGEVGQGYEILADVLASDRLVACARIASSLKRLLNVTIAHTFARKTFGKRMIEFDLVQKRLSECATYLYVLESMIYLTAGIADYQTDVDVGAESATTRRFALNACKVVTHHCLALQGGKTYLRDDPHRKLAVDLRAYEWWDSTDDVLAMYVAVNGIGVAGMERQEKVRVFRNPFANPIDYVKNMIRMRRYITGKPKLSLKLGGCVHPTLEREASMLESHVHMFGHTVNMHLVHHGSNSVSIEADLIKMADVAMSLYAMTSCLARASRSYCDGHAHGSVEVALARIFVHTQDKLLKLQMETMLDFQENQVDVLHQMVGARLERAGTYPIVHAITKNVF